MNLLNWTQKRRSCYALKNQIPLQESQFIYLVREAVKQAPSAFNSQSARVLVLLANKHHAFWQLTLEALRKIVSPDTWPVTQAKIDSFDKAYGTILYFEDWSVVENLQTRFPMYRDSFPVWAYQSNAMLEYSIWTALAVQNIGASLQHYNPLVDQAVKKAFQVPEHWKLIAQMPLGAIVQHPEEKTFLPLEERVIVFK